jgi:hypothetical protein
MNGINNNIQLPGLVLNLLIFLGEFKIWKVGIADVQDSKCITFSNADIWDLKCF